MRVRALFVSAVASLLFALPAESQRLVFPFDRIDNPMLLLTLRGEQGGSIANRVVIGFPRVPLNPFVGDLEVQLPPGVPFTGELRLEMEAIDAQAPLVLQESIGVPSVPLTLRIDRFDLVWPDPSFVWEIPLGTQVITRTTLDYEIDGELDVGGEILPITIRGTCEDPGRCMRRGLLDTRDDGATMIRQVSYIPISFQSLNWDLGTAGNVDFDMDIRFEWDRMEFAPEPHGALAAALALLGLARRRARMRKPGAVSA